MRQSIALRIWLPRLVSNSIASASLGDCNQASILSILKLRARTGPAVDVSMASYRADGAFLQGDDGVDLSPSPPPLIDALL
jgi:hypothetical protein